MARLSAGASEGDEASRLQESLSSVLRQQGDRGQLANLRRVTGGNSRETWFFDVLIQGDGAASTQGFVLTRDGGGQVAETSREAEARLLAALGGSSVPVPTLKFFDAYGGALGRPGMIVTRYEAAGHRHLLHRRDPAGLGISGQQRIAAAMTSLLARIHEVDIRSAGVAEALGAPPADPAAAELDKWAAQLDRLGQPWPALEFARDWLWQHLPAAPRASVLVHGDFRPANLLVAEGEIVGVIDWEFARLGDFHDDLGWYLTPNYAADHFIPGQWEAADFLRYYADVRGVDIDLPVLDFWRRMASFRLAIMAIADSYNFRNGVSDHPRPPINRIVGHLAAEVLAAPRRAERR
jgi:aminoglycoside phosphotransferase (APT) family kinase protein